MKKLLLSVATAAMLCAVAACSRPHTDLMVASQPNVNPDFTGRPSPVVVKVYELRRGVAFKQADFQALFDNPVQVLGSDILAADELVFVPGEARTISYLPNPEARFLGIVAGFRQMNRARWRSLRPINADDENIIALELSDASILVLPDAKAKDWNPEEAVRRQPPPEEPELPAARTRAQPPSAEEQNLTAYDREETPPAPPRTTPPEEYMGPEELEQARRMPPQGEERTPGMAEPEAPRSGGEDAGHPARGGQPAAEPYAVPPMRTSR